MAEDELTRDEVFVLARAFSTASARTLLSLAGFPSWAIPETGYANALEFWSKIAEQIAAGVMADGRREILRSASEWYPANQRFAALAAAAARAAPESAPAGPTATRSTAPGSTVSVADGKGFMIGDHNIQINLGAVPSDAARPPAAADPATPVRVLVIGADPVREGLSPVRSDREAGAIESIAQPGRIEVRKVLSAELTDVRYVGLFRPDIVHLVCDGIGDRLVFSDQQGKADYVPASLVADELRFYCDKGGVRLRAVVLAACDGEALAPYFTGVADTVIAHRGRLRYPGGVAFAEQFYALLNSGQVPADDGQADGDPADPNRSGSDLAAIAREAARLTARDSAAGDPMIANLIVLRGGS